ncbi:RNA polymerase sigma factor SigJ [Ampullimonas aquatilis]|uniref:RNA polymerase sigma factor SigJ n=1 Tax=Ampullimonas aquatilis TaxID=1341549 RepID=UPI003C7445D2
MSIHLAPFNQQRPRLFGIAYRMLGSRAEAEDIVQEAYIRWSQSDLATIESVPAWLVTVTSRLSIDRLRVLKQERASYPGPWLPEPVNDIDYSTPETLLEFQHDLSFALMVVLEALTAEERAAFLLREVFDQNYADLAKLLNKTDAACRQLVHRARERVRAQQPRFKVSKADHLRVLQQFMRAASSGNRQDILHLLHDDVISTSDGGGKVMSTNRPLHGPQRISWLYYAVARRFGAQLEWCFAMVNGEAAIARYFESNLHSVMMVQTDGQQVTRIFNVMNPDKLQRLNMSLLKVTVTK